MCGCVARNVDGAYVIVVRRVRDSHMLFGMCFLYIIIRLVCSVYECRVLSVPFV